MLLSKPLRNKQLKKLKRRDWLRRKKIERRRKNGTDLLLLKRIRKMNLKPKKIRKKQNIKRNWLLSRKRRIRKRLKD